MTTMKPATTIPCVLCALLTACASAPTTDASGMTRGQVFGVTNAKVCLDRNGNARCDDGEPSTMADANGAFALAGAGAFIAEATTPHGPVVLRAPADSVAAISPVSTELMALMDADGSSPAKARALLARRIGVPEARLLDTPSTVADGSAQTALRTESAQLLPRIAAAVASAGADGDRVRALRTRLALDAIDTVVVIFAENRGFDNLYGLYPGANGVPGRNPASRGGYEPQRDFDGSVLPVLPPAWGGLTAGGQPVTLTQAQSAGLPNQPFQIDSAQGIGDSKVVVPSTIVTRDLVHRYYNNIMQINGGRNDRFAAYSDAGGLSMGYYDGSHMQLWKLAQQYTLADNFFMGAFGGSYLNHQYLICACIPVYPGAENTPAKELISEVDVDAQGRFVKLSSAANMPATVLAGAPRYKVDGALTATDASGAYYTINTMQPPFQPSGNAPVAGADARYADPARPTTLPPQTLATIGDTLDARRVPWAWYAGSWTAASADTPEARAIIYRGKVQFQPHHQPFNYYARFDPATHATARTAHLKDFDGSFLGDAAAGKLPPVAFYKPQGSLNQHAGYASVAEGDAHIAGVIEKLRQSPQWPHMLIVVTYDENGGFYDHAPVPKGDRWGPGTRIPALIISPYAKKGFVDSTQYDTASILRFITHRWSLAELPGIKLRDESLLRNGSAPMGDLTGALDF
ncbi:acid phosphatase [soil metagenome]